MIIDCKYFVLKQGKSLDDGTFISPEQKLLYICTEEDMMRLETVDNTDIKRIFWSSIYDVNFLNEIQEDWSEEKIAQREKEIKGQWL